MVVGGGGAFTAKSAVCKFYVIKLKTASLYWPMSNFDPILANRERRKLWTGAERLVPGNEVATYSRMLQLNGAQRSAMVVRWPVLNATSSV